MQPSLQPADAGCDASGRAHPRWRDRFIEHLEHGSSIARAAERAGISLKRAHRARRTEPAFARAWEEAIARSYDNLELELLRRLREGDQLAQDGTKYDFASAIRLLALHRGRSLRVHAEERSVSAAEIRASIDRKIADIRHRISDESGSKGTAQ